MEELILFILSFLLIYFIYLIIFIGPSKKNKKKKEMIEIRYLKARYNLDFDKISYPQLLQICGLVSSLDIALVVSIVSLFDNFWLKIGIGFIAIFVFIIVSYHLIYLFYKKKGMVINGKD